MRKKRSEYCSQLTLFIDLPYKLFLGLHNIFLIHHILVDVLVEHHQGLPDF
jgi:hypothetical protein